jgi:transposase
VSNRRFEMYEYRQVIARMRMGESDRRIARAGLMGRTKVSQARAIALAEGWLTAESPLPDDAAIAAVLSRKPPEPHQGSLVAAYEQDVRSWLEQGISGTTIHEALVRKYGFPGSYSSVRRFLQGLKHASPDATVILEFEPAEAAQVDFAKGPTIVDATTGEEISTWIFVMTLCWSRHQYAEIIRDQTVATWLGCHRRAFEFFGAVPKRLIIDNPKCAITKACFHDPEVQRAYGEAAEAYRFLISPCPPKDPKKKGRVESGVKYLKNSFLPLREFRSLGDGNRQLREWILSTAGNRIHGTTKERPLTLFTETERHLLQALPDVPPELATWARVKLHGDCHVRFEKTLYSAPFRLVRRELWLKASETAVKIFYNLELVAVHPRLRRPGTRSTVREHLPPEAVAYLMRDPQWCLKEAERIGPQCKALIQELFSDRVLDNLRAAQGVIRLGKTCGPSRLEAACRRALAYDNPRYRTVKTILEKGLDQIDLVEPALDQLHETYRRGGRFSREIGTLLLH